MILGIDEVGRGPWAGPLVIGAVVLGGAEIEGLTDSKKLTKKRRETLDVEIREKADGFGLGWVEACEIDEIGLSAALKLATRRAVGQITVPYHEIIIDGTINFLSDTNKGQYVTTMKKADLLVPSVSAASIIAKVARDNFMIEQDVVYPGYGFAKHVGYGTAAHIAAIDKLGVTPLHRLSFAPLQKYADAKILKSSRELGHPNPPLGPAARSAPDFRMDYHSQNRVLPRLASPALEGFGIPIHRTPLKVSKQTTTKSIGDAAENEAAKYLTGHGHKILNRNWKTKYCEIDIVSHKNNTIYFTEVKYRKKPDQGGGLAVITPQKLRQMKFATELYVISNQINDVDLRLSVISLSGWPPDVEVYLEVE
jgi:ribonuclease HII